MSAITEGAVSSMFAIAQSNPLLLFNGKGLRLEFRTLMRTIAKRLILRFAASTPIESTRV